MARRSSYKAVEPSVVEEQLRILLPDAACSLVFHNAFEALVATLLSAQCTDAKVNAVTPSLFSKYPTPVEMAEASLIDVEAIIKPLGLYHAKAKNVIALSKILAESFGGEVPIDFDTLVGLPGVGKKTAGVVLAEVAGRPAIPVDTHIKRVAFRLGYVKEGEEPFVIEKKLEKLFPKEVWIALHHRLIHFGRQVCLAISPKCDICPFKDKCPYLLAKSSSKAARKS